VELAYNELRNIALANPFERAIRVHTVAGRQRSPALSSLMNLFRSADRTRYEKKSG